MTGNITKKIKKQSNWDIIKKILQNYKLETKWFWLVITLMILWAWLELGFPYISKQLISLLENKKPISDAVPVFIFWIIFVTSVVSLNYYKDALSAKWYSILENKLLQKYRNMIWSFPISTLIDQWSGKLISKFEQWVSSELSIFKSIVRVSISCFIRWGSIIIIYFYYDYRLVLMLMPIVAIYWYIEYKVWNKIEDIWEKTREINEDKTKNMVKFFTEFTTIKIWNKISNENIELDTTINKLPSLLFKESYLWSFKYDILRLLFYVFEYSIIFFFIYIGVQEWYAVADVMLLTTYIRWFRRPLSEFISSFSSFQSSVSKYQNLQEFLDTPQTISNGADSYQYKNGDIYLDNVTFSYNEDKQILQNFSLNIPGGKTLALVGNSGSGKSTIIKLLLRLYDPQSWSIMIDNQNLKDLEIETLYDNIGYLTQEPAVFDGSIRENMMYGAPANIITDFSWYQNSSQWRDNLIREALDHAKCGFVRSMKEGLETQIGERWVKLSWWEKQRLAIARIFFKNPHILILDEPTAALDSISEHHITNTLHELFANKTVIVIAHRLQTVMNADKIIVLEEGKIVQSGKHNELLSQEGLYKQLVDLQSGVVKEE